MGKTCLNCGYQRKPLEDAPDYACPACDIVYAKYEKKLLRDAGLGEDESESDSDAVAKAMDLFLRAAKEKEAISAATKENEARVTKEQDLLIAWVAKEKEAIATKEKKAIKENKAIATKEKDKKLREAWCNLNQEIRHTIHKNIRTLKLAYSKTVYQDVYGNCFYDKWSDAVDYFIDKVLFNNNTIASALLKSQRFENEGWDQEIRRTSLGIYSVIYQGNPVALITRDSLSQMVRAAVDASNTAEVPVIDDSLETSSNEQEQNYFEDSWLSEARYKDGVEITRIVTYWLKNGQKLREIHYKNGIKEGQGDEDLMHIISGDQKINNKEEPAWLDSFLNPGKRVTWYKNEAGEVLIKETCIQNQDIKPFNWRIFFIVFFILTGMIWGFQAYNMETTVMTGGHLVLGEYIPSQAINNIGLMDDRRNNLMISGFITLVGVILLAVHLMRTPPALVTPSLFEDTRECPYCAELVKAKAKLCKHCGKELSELNT